MGKFSISAPFPLGDEFKVFGVNSSNLPLCQRKFTVRLVKGWHRILRFGVNFLSAARTASPLILSRGVSA